MHCQVCPALFGLPAGGCGFWGGGRCWHMPSSVFLLCDNREVGSPLWASVSSCAKRGWVLPLKEPSTPALSDSHRGPPFGPRGVSGPTCAGSGLRPGLAQGSLGASLASAPPASLCPSCFHNTLSTNGWNQPPSCLLSWLALGPCWSPHRGRPLSGALVFPGAGVLPTSHLWLVSEPSSPLP